MNLFDLKNIFNREWKLNSIHVNLDRKLNEFYIPVLDINICNSLLIFFFCFSKTATIETAWHIIITILCSWVAYKWARSIATIRRIGIAVHKLWISFIICTIIAFLILIIHTAPIVGILILGNFSYGAPWIIGNCEENTKKNKIVFNTISMHRTLSWV